MITVRRQDVDTWKKRITHVALKGSTYFCQQSGEVWVSASVDHQAICQRVLGPPGKNISGLDSYICWENVSSTDLVEVLSRISEVR